MKYIENIEDMENLVKRTTEQFLKSNTKKKGTSSNGMALKLAVTDCAVNCKGVANLG
ncbi:hypothetical protein D3C75_1345980 [compost metagenome]